MSRVSKSLPGPSRLSGILNNLNQPPRAALPSLRSLALTLAARNAHFGPRHFVNEDLPRIRHANPDLSIQIHRIPRSQSDQWKSELLLEFKDGQTRSIDVSTMRSTAIFEEVMNIGGGERWRRFVEERAAKAGVDNGAELSS